MPYELLRVAYGWSIFAYVFSIILFGPSKKLIVTPVLDMARGPVQAPQTELEK